MTVRAGPILQNYNDLFGGISKEDKELFSAAPSLVKKAFEAHGIKLYKSEASIVASFIVLSKLFNEYLYNTLPDDEYREKSASTVEIIFEKDEIKKVAAEFFGVKDKTFSAKLSELKKKGIIEEFDDGLKLTDEKGVWVLEAEQGLKYVIKKIDDIKKVEKLNKKKEEAVGELLGDILAASDEEDGYLLVSVVELQNILEKYETRLTLNVIKKVEEKARVGGKFTKVTLIDYDDLHFTDINDLAKIPLYSLVRIKGRVTVVNRDDEQRVVYAKYVEYDEDGSVWEEEEVYYDFVYDKNIKEKLKKKVILEDGTKETVELEKDYEEVVPVYKLRLISDDGGKYVTVITYQTKAAEIKPGDTIEVVGFIDQIRKKTGGGNVVSQGGLFIRAYNVRKLSDVDIDFSDERVEEFKKFATEGDVLDRLIDMLDVTEDQRHAAKAILLALASEKGFRGVNDKQIRTHLHVLMISDAGTGKSTLMRTFSNILNLDKPVNAKAASVAGILGTAREDPIFGWYVEAGLLPRNNRRMGVFIDELDKADESLIAALHSPFEDGWTIIEKAGKARFPSLTSIIAAANPKEELDDFRHVFEQVNLKKTLLDRFDIIVALRQPPVEVKKKVNEEIIEFMLDGEDLEEEREKNREFVRDYLYYAYYIHKVRGTEPGAREALARFVNLYDNIRTQNKQSKRLAVTLSRIAAAVAKIRLHDKITVDDAMEAIKIFIETQATLLPVGEREELQKLIDAAQDINKLAEILGIVERKSEEAQEVFKKNVIEVVKAKLLSMSSTDRTEVMIKILARDVAGIVDADMKTVEEIIRNLPADFLDNLAIQYLDAEKNPVKSGDEAVYITIPAPLPPEEDFEPLE